MNNDRNFLLRGEPPPATWGSRLAAFAGLSSYTIGRGNTGPYEYLQLLKRFGFVDITPDLQAAARAFQGKALIYYPGNVHFTAAGNRVVAQVLSPVITGQTKDAAR
jgi:hypothetical protein